MHVWIAAFIIAFTPVFAWADVDPLNLYGETIRFDVVRDGKVVGEHETRFAKVDDDLVVTSRMSLEIFVLIFPVYAFDYQSVETWRNDRLNDLKVRVLDGNEEVKVSATASGDLLRVSGPEGIETVEDSILSTNHWNASVVQDQKVINTLTGRINRVSIERGGVEVLSLPQGDIKATRYDYNGDLRDTSVWYDREGRWVKLQFKAKDGSTIHYRCTTCEADA